MGIAELRALTFDDLAACKMTAQDVGIVLPQLREVLEGADGLELPQASLGLARIPDAQGTPVGFRGVGGGGGAAVVRRPCDSGTARVVCTRMPGHCAWVVRWLWTRSGRLFPETGWFQ